VNISHVNYVLEVYACGSINKAAHNLYISQSCVSNAIKKLEADLGYKIFTRKNNSIALTPEGTAFLEPAKAIMNEVEKIKNIPQAFQSQKNLSIVCNHSALIMQSLITFKKSNADNNLQDSFKETGIVTARKDVIEQRYRLAVCYCFSQRTDHHVQIASKYNLEVEMLHQNIPVVALLCKRNPLSAKSSVTIGEISSHKLVCFEDFEYDDWLKILGIPSTSNVFYIFDRGGLAEAVRKDNYIALMINDPMQTKEMKDCIAVPIAGIDESLDMFLLRPRSYVLNKREKDFLRFIKAKLQEVHKALV